MNKSEWLETWARIKDRFPNWQPSATEAEDWCLALKIYTCEVVDNAGRSVAQNYASKTPSLKWLILNCEKQKRESRINNAPPEPSWQDVRDAFDKEREQSITRLEAVPLDELRTATASVLRKNGNLIKKPDDANVREWKNTLRSLVYCELFEK